MYEELGQVTLRTGEKVRAGVVVGPDLEWAERIEDLLAHKGEPWNWQNSAVLREEVGVEARFHILHRDGAPFANILTTELAGVGLFGHVWTNPEDRQQSAASQLTDIQMADFARRGGKALFLGTGYDSTAYRIYQRHGFRGIEPASGLMAFYAETEDAFCREYFAAGSVEVQEVDWRHWPASAALFLGDFPGRVRCAPLKMLGRGLTEGPLLPLIRSERERRRDGGGDQPAGLALVNTDTAALVGLAARGAHPLWRGVTLADVYCHPDHWARAGELLAGVLPPAGEACVAYADEGFELKADALGGAGFAWGATLGRRLASGAGGPGNVVVWERDC
jgi:hypothetical protein